MKKYLYLGLLSLSGLCALVASIMFVVVSRAGYLAGNPFNIAVIILGIIAALGVVLTGFTKIIKPKVGMIIQIICALLLTTSFVFLLNDKASFIGDSFIPMQRSDAFYSSLGVTYASIILLALSIIVLAITAFIGAKEEAK